MNFARWFILHKKDPNCLNDLGGLRFCTASVFVIFSVTDGEMWWPSQSIWFLKILNFATFNARFSSFNFFCTFSTNSSCSVPFPFETMRISSRKQKVFFCVVDRSVHGFSKLGRHVSQTIKPSEEPICSCTVSPTILKLQCLAVYAASFN